MVGYLLQSSSLREKDKKGENPHKACEGTLSCGSSLTSYAHFLGTEPQQALQIFDKKSISEEDVESKHSKKLEHQE